MLEQNYSLEQLLEMLTNITNIHVCIHDISGICNGTKLSISYPYTIHSKNFCNIAKSTQKGYETCIQCKIFANCKAVDTKKLFHGYCPYGLYEIVQPVVIDEKVQCIIYIGNIVMNEEITSHKLKNTSMLTKVETEHLITQLNEAQRVNTLDYYIFLAQFINDNIRRLNEEDRGTDNVKNTQYHWAVLAIKNMIQDNFRQKLSLESIAKLYFMNEKYIGRLFKEQMGHTFREYMNMVRLKYAANQLIETREKVIVIALESGYQNVTYFNKIFLEAYGVTPAKYRKLYGN